MTYLLLIYEFAKTGLFTVGGGMATIPFLLVMADKYPWFDEATLVDMIAISESTPGPIGINMATYAGYSAAGVPGGIIASLAMIVPSIVIVAAISRMMLRYNENAIVKSAFYGLRPCAAALVAAAGIKIAALTFFDLPEKINITSSLGFNELLFAFRFKELIMFFVLFFAIRYIKKARPVVIIAVAAFAGVVLQL